MLQNSVRTGLEATFQKISERLGFPFYVALLPALMEIPYLDYIQGNKK